MRYSQACPPAPPSPCCAAARILSLCLPAFTAGSRCACAAHDCIEPLLRSSSQSATIGGSRWHGWQTHSAGQLDARGRGARRCARNIALLRMEEARESTPRILHEAWRVLHPRRACGIVWSKCAESFGHQRIPSEPVAQRRARLHGVQKARVRVISGPQRFPARTFGLLDTYQQVMFRKVMADQARIDR